MAAKSYIVAKIAYNHFPELSAAMKSQTRQIVWRTALRIERGYKQRMEGPKHGRVYRKGSTEKTYSAYRNAWKKHKGANARFVGGKVIVTVVKYHQASAPGEGPAVDLGHLRASIGAEMTGERSAVVYASAIYAARLELGGTARGVMIEPRPALMPEADEALKQYTKEVEQMLKGLG